MGFNIPFLRNYLKAIKFSVLNCYLMCTAESWPIMFQNSFFHERKNWTKPTLKQFSETFYFVLVRSLNLFQL